MNDAYTPATWTPTPADRLAWKVYEARSTSAHLQYLAMPSSLGFAGTVTACGCGRRTESRYGTCRRCLRAERMAS